MLLKRLLGRSPPVSARNRMQRASSSLRSPFPILETVEQVRAWRRPLLLKEESVGFVPTMGNLHKGHLELVKRSLRECQHTAVSIFVNPAQFAPNEDLANYPRTLQADIDALASVQDPESNRKVSALFLPQVHTLYPAGIQQDVESQVGTFTDVKGYSHQMEGSSRPTFFRGVATVVIKLFNIVQPDWTYFGQKDIQQCFVLRQMLRDLHLPYPPSPNHLVICPTERDQTSGIALSSRNGYLSAAERAYAPVLYKALQAAVDKYQKVFHDSKGVVPTLALQEAATAVVEEAGRRAKVENVDLRLIYIAVNSPKTLNDMTSIEPNEGCILSGAVWLGRTRLIDNLVLNFDLNPVVTP